jgi:hypothetical protein
MPRSGEPLVMLDTHDLGPQQPPCDHHRDPAGDE